MQLSRRAKRMEQHHRRAKRNPGLNLVSLMDIFTILVFFLLVSSAEVQDIPTTKAVQLPESTSLEKPRETLIIVVTSDSIIFREKTIAKIADIKTQEGDVIEPLKASLTELVTNKTVLPIPQDATGPDQYEIMIQGDREIPYKVLRKIIVSCTEAQFNNIYLAVVQKTNVGG